jgi:hypothetical protein
VLDINVGCDAIRPKLNGWGVFCCCGCVNEIAGVFNAGVITVDATGVLDISTGSDAVIPNCQAVFCSCGCSPETASLGIGGAFDGNDCNDGNGF